MAPIEGRDMAGVAARVWALILILGAAFFALLAIVSAGGQELTPRHANDGSWAIASAIGMGVLCFAGSVYRAPPPSVRAIGSVLLASLIVTFVWCPVAGLLMLPLHEIADFAGRDAVEQERDLPIDAAGVHRGRSIRFQVWLRDYPVRLQVTEADYRAAFGEADHPEPVDMCVHVTIKVAGDAQKIEAWHTDNLPSGALERCPVRR